MPVLKLDPRPLQDGAYLLAVLSRDEDDKVLCQAPGCRRPIFAEVHVIAEVSGRVRVLGSRCAGLLHLGQADSSISDKPSVSPHPGEAVVSLDPETRAEFDAETLALARQYQTAFAAHQREQQLQAQARLERERRLEKVRRERAAEEDRRLGYLSVLRTIYGEQARQELAGPRHDEIVERTIQHLQCRPELVSWREPALRYRLEAEAEDMLVQQLARDDAEEHEHEAAAY
jgi:hypothetical protein